MANAPQSFRSEEMAWTPVSAPLQPAGECQELSSSRLLINAPRKNQPSTLRPEPSSRGPAKARGWPPSLQGESLSKYWGSLEAIWKEGNIYFCLCTVILQNKLASRLAPKCDLTQAVAAAKLRVHFSFRVLGICAVGFVLRNEKRCSQSKATCSQNVGFKGLENTALIRT